MTNNKVKLNYSFCTDPDRQDAVIISVTGTGINLENANHARFMDALLKVIASQMYGKAHNIPIENIKV